MKNSQRICSFISLLVTLSMILSSIIIALSKPALALSDPRPLLSQTYLPLPPLDMDATFSQTTKAAKNYAQALTTEMDVSALSVERGEAPQALAIVHASSTSTDTLVFLPVVYNNWQQIMLPGLSFIPPSGWRPPAETTVPLTATNDITGTATAHMVSPSGTHFIGVIVDWFAPPPTEAIFGNFAMPPDNRYQESVRQLPSGELVQVMRTTTTMDGSVFLLAHAAFRSDRASYSLGLYGEALDVATWDVFSSTLSSMSPNTTTLPAGGRRQTMNDIAFLSSSTRDVQDVAYDRNAAVNYANTFVNAFDNSDDCYLWYNNAILLCYYQEGHWGVDGAHFVNRALKAGGLPAPEVPHDVSKKSDSLRSWLLANGGQEIADPYSLEPGDVIFFGTVGGCWGRTWGWTGVVIDQNGPGPRLHLHSRVSGGITSNWPYARYDQVAYNNCDQPIFTLLSTSTPFKSNRHLCSTNHSPVLLPRLL